MSNYFTERMKPGTKYIKNFNQYRQDLITSVQTHIFYNLRHMCSSHTV